MLRGIGTDCTGSCKSNYHTITTMTAPEIYNEYVIPLKSYQHGGPNIILLLELCDKDMSIYKSFRIILFYLSNNICHPLKLLLCSSYPQEVHLRKKYINGYNKYQTDFIIMPCIFVDPDT